MLHYVFILKNLVSAISTVISINLLISKFVINNISNNVKNKHKFKILISKKLLKASYIFLEYTHLSKILFLTDHAKHRIQVLKDLDDFVTENFKYRKIRMIIFCNDEKSLSIKTAQDGQEKYFFMCSVRKKSIHPT